MSQPQQGYAQDGYPQSPTGHDEYGQDEHQSSQQQAALPPGQRKKRAYAGQAYEFGAGANSALGGQQQAGGQYGQYNNQQEQAGYPQGGYAQTPAAATQPQPEPPMLGGYQPPAPTYPTQNTGQGMAQMTQQFGHMDMSQKPPAPAPGLAQQTRLNQLYPTDLMNQPLNVAELDYPPPPAVLPPNVGF